jgi:GntR family transcriptional regulator of arabinose operon
MAAEPKYQQVVDWVKENIEDGKFRPGDRLMSEAELSEKFSLSRQTIRHATGELAAMGYVTRVRGSGTYIGGMKKSVREERYMSIAVVSTFYESYIFPPTLKGIERVLSKNGYSMQVSFTDNKVHREEAILRNLLEKNNIDGLIVEPAKSALPNPNIHYYQELKARDIPIICFNAQYPDLDAPCVRLDDKKIAEQAAGLLIEAGHTSIAGIFKPDDGQGRFRYEGFLNALVGNGIPVDEKKVIWIDTTDYRDISTVEDHLFARIGDATGVVCYNDEVAYQLIELALKRGIRVPEDLSVVGIDDSYLAGVSRVPFTSFPHPKDLLGSKVAENLLAMIDHPDYDGNYLFGSEPVIRGSVKSFFEDELNTVSECRRHEVTGFASDRCETDIKSVL